MTYGYYIGRGGLLQARQESELRGHEDHRVSICVAGLRVLVSQRSFVDHRGAGGIHWGGSLEDFSL